MNAIARTPSRCRQAGMTIIELLIAGVVLVVGLLAVVGLFATAIGSNGRSRIDTTATMVSQSVIEQITAVLARGGPAMIKDCQGTGWNIETDAGGAALSGSGIDFTQSPPANYFANFAVCNGTATTTYDVRWHITNLSNQTSLVTVAARPKNMVNNGRFTFSLPVTFRTYVGDDR